MIDNLFKNPGKKIKTMAVILFWLEVIASVILAFVLGINDSYYGISFNAGIFFVYLLGGPAGAYISSLILTGFGELVENSSKTELQKETDFARDVEENDVLYKLSSMINVDDDDKFKFD